MTNERPSQHRDNRYCGGKLRGEPREDGRTTCTRPAGWGTDHPGWGRCKLHGGATPSLGKRAVIERATAEVELWGGRRDIHPADALLELVHTKAAEVAYWRQRVAAIDDPDLTWATTRRDAGMDKGAPTDMATSEAQPHIALRMLHKAEADLAAYSSAALKAGVDEAKLRLAELQAGWVINLARAALVHAGVTGPAIDAAILHATNQIEGTRDDA